jgi:hypothetical protein
MSYEYESSLGAPDLRAMSRVGATRTEILLGGRPSAKRTAAAAAIDEARREAAAAEKADYLRAQGGGFPSNDNAAPGDGDIDLTDTESEYTPFTEESNAPIAIWIGLGALILGGGGFVAYKLWKRRQASPPPQEMP